MFKKVYKAFKKYFTGNQFHDEAHWIQAQFSKNEKMIQKSKINA